MPQGFIPEKSWDPTLKQNLILYYRNLVQTEINEPIPLRSTFLGVDLSTRMSDELVSSQKLIASIGSSGVFDDGIPFYHLHTQTLSSDELKRLDANDVRLKTGKFQPSEDDQLRRNWEDYCEIAGIDLDEAPYYMGCSVDRQKKQGSRYFRAWMCRALPDRSGIQVYRRAQVIFHEANEDGGYSRPWTKDELNIVLELGPSGKWADIGAKLNRPRYHCHKVYMNAIQQGINEVDEEDKDMKLLYRHVTKAIGKDPVNAFVNGHLNELEQTIDWEKIGQLLSRGPKRCRKLFKKLKHGMEEAKEKSESATTLQLMKCVRKSLPKVCRPICRMQNKKKPYLRVSPKRFSQHIKDLCAYHEEEIKTLNKPYRFTKIFIASQALEEYDEKSRLSILRRLTYVMSVFQDRGIFDFLPIKNRELLTKLNLVRYVMKKVYYTKMKTTQAFEFAKRYIEKQGWTAKRLVHAYKLEEEKPAKLKKAEN